MATFLIMCFSLFFELLNGMFDPLAILSLWGQAADIESQDEHDYENSH